MNKFLPILVFTGVSLMLAGCPQTTVHLKHPDGGAKDAGEAGQNETGEAGKESGADAAADASADATVDAQIDGSCACHEKNECCDGCSQINEGQSCQGEQSDCADDLCNNGVCVQQVKAGFCLIDGNCYGDGKNSPEEPCKYCDSLFSASSWRNKPKATKCDDGLFCNGTDTCDDKGECFVHASDPCASGDVCNNQCNDKDDTCFSPEGTTCGDDTDNECTAPDTCDGRGACRPNNQPNATPCGDDTDNECTAPDTCDFQGVCQPNNQPKGAVCGDNTDNECTAPDTCDGEGACQSNNVAEGKSCFGEDLMIYAGLCNDAGVCTGKKYCDDHDCWKTPPTAQTKCYNISGEITCSACDSSGKPDFCGQDGKYADNPRAFESVTSGYHDTLTDLVWASSPESSAMTWSSCNSTCANKVVGNDADWRIPDVYEMAGVFRYNSCDAFSDLAGIDGYYYWTNTVDASNSSNVWIVTPIIMCGAVILSMPKTENTSTYCRCVRGKNLSHKDTGGNRFFETGPLGERIILDRATGLLWQRSYLDVSSGKTWKDALAYCESSVYGGYDEWRLPNINELFSLVSMDKAGTASEFPAMPSLVFFSSTTSMGMLSVAWVVDFSTGRTNSNNKENSSAVRCVRGGP